LLGYASILSPEQPRFLLNLYDQTNFPYIRFLRYCVLLSGVCAGVCRCKLWVQDEDAGTDGVYFD
jgi:hypothetical protein